MAENLFIALEGIDGSGKSTQVKKLGKNFEDSGFKSYTTSEPTDHEIGRLIRSVFSHKIKADQHTIAALFVADRLQHILDPDSGLLKKKNDGFNIVSDRYYFSSYAYHSVHVDMDWVIASNNICAQLLRPDITIFIDIAPQICMERMKKERIHLEMYETLENLIKVRENYFTAFEKLKSRERVVIIDGNRPQELIADEIFSVSQQLLNQKKQ